MKKILSLMTAMLMLCFAFTSCGDDDEEDNPVDNGKEQTGNALDAFFPTGYDASNVAAWYSTTDIEKEEGKTKVMAVYIFNDNKVLVTKHKTKNDGSETYEIEFVGTITITEGDYENGKAMVNEMNMEVTISNGVLSAMDEQFEKQNNSKIPAAKSVTSNEGDNNGSATKALFPKGYDPSKVAAWYYGETDYASRSMYFFNDGTFILVGTQKEEGLELKGLMADGKYTLEGNSKNGVYTMSPTGSETGNWPVENGQMATHDEDEDEPAMTLQDNDKIPEPAEIPDFREMLSHD
jgi:hypothetical protein